MNPKTSKSELQENLSNSWRSGVSPRTSLGSRLLIYVLGSAIAGLGILAILFYQDRVSSAKREIEQKLGTEVNAVQAKLGSVRQSGLDLAATAKTINRIGVKDADSYRLAVQEQFKNVDPAVVGLGIAQASNQLLSDRKSFYPYFSQDGGLEFKYEERLVTGDAFSEQIGSKQTVWLEPFSSQSDNKILTSLIMPFYNEANSGLGVVVADVNVNTLVAKSGGVINDVGYVMILSASGNLLAYPPDKAKSLRSYKTIPEINDVWGRFQSEQSGLIQFGGNFWAYRRIPLTNWLMVAAVPESSVVLPILLGTVVSTLVAAMLLAIAVNRFRSQLNQRLKPILDECNRLAEAKGANLVLASNEDEIEQLSSSFHNLISQISSNENQIREEVARVVQSQERLNQARESQQEAEFLEGEVGGLLDVVSAMEEGDLTMEAEVSDRATGLVADTLNRLREQLAEIIAKVLGTAQQVVRGAQDLQELSRIVADNTVEQAQSVAQGVTLTERVAIAAQGSASQANTANKSLLTAQITVEEGQVAINTLTEGISVLQKGTAQIVQKIKTLGEFVGLAQQFVQDQGQIASLTQVLAINATLVAARAAEQRDPKQFIGVAREFEAIAGQVNNLANQTNEGLAVLQQRTSQIQSVVSAIDAEVQSLGGLVEGFNSGVEQSQTAFYSIQKVTEQVVKVGQTITESSFEIAEAADTTVRYMSEIDTLATQTASLTSSTRLQAEQMGTLAQKLLAGIQFFRLPEALMATLEDTGINTGIKPDLKTVDIMADSNEN